MIRPYSLIAIVILDEPEDEADGSEPGSPKPPTSAEEIPLSYVGSILLLAGKLNRKSLKSEDLSSVSIKIFPEHAILTNKYLPEDAPPAIIDALVFIGGWILRHNNKEGDVAELGPIPNQEEEFFLYIQVCYGLECYTNTCISITKL